MDNTTGKAAWQGLTLDYCAVTDRGQVRKVNEDNFLVSPEFLLFAVADGMGGHTAGDFASRLTLESVHAFIALNDDPHGVPMQGISEDWLSLPPLAGAAHFANARVNAAAGGKVMGSTLVAARFGPAQLELVHVGDSRCYLWRHGELRQLTTDHSLVQALFSSGRISREEMRTHPQKNVITQAIGPQPEMEPHYQAFAPSRGDRLLLCSDGLTGMVPDADIARQLGSGHAVAEITNHLVVMANQAGGRDNITAVVVGIA